MPVFFITQRANFFKRLLKNKICLHEEYVDKHKIEHISANFLFDQNQKNFRSLLTFVDIMEWANKPSHGTVPAIEANKETYYPDNLEDLLDDVDAEEDE